MARDYLCLLGLLLLGVYLGGSEGDRCDVCRRHLDRCRVFSGEFTTFVLPTGYNQIREIPSGACSINITELGPSSNYLALKTESGRDVLNSHWAIASPGQYKRAGTVFKYGRVRDKNCPGECVLALGPTNETIYIQLLTYHTNPGIIYQYQLPGVGRGWSSKGRHRNHGNRHQGHHRQRHLKRQHRPKVNSIFSSLSDTKPYTATVYSKRVSAKQHHHQSRPDRTRGGWNRELSPHVRGRSDVTTIPIGQKHPLTGNQEVDLTRTNYRQGELKSEGADHHPDTNLFTRKPVRKGSTAARSHKKPQGTLYRYHLPSSSERSHHQYRQPSSVRESPEQSHGSIFDYRGHPYGRDALTLSGPREDTGVKQREHQRGHTNEQKSDLPLSKASSVGSVSPFNLRSPKDVVIGRKEGEGSYFPYREDLHQQGSNYRPSTGADLEPFDPYNFPEVTSPPLVGPYPQLKVRQEPKYVSPYGEDLPYGHIQPFTDQKGARHGTDTYIGYDKQGLVVPDEARGGQNQPYLPEQNSNAIPLHIPDPDYSLQGEVRTVHYSWRISGFTECSLSCGGGVQETVIICVKGNSEVTVTAENCETRTKPDPQEIQCNTQPCPPAWEEGEWSECSVSCGSGIQRRRVECKKRISSRLQISVSANQCSDEDKPSIVQQCQSTPCARWKTEEWGLCSVKCGKGERRRRVLCVSDNDSPIPDRMCEGPGPKSSEHCDRGPCTRHWFYSDWTNHCSTTCGAGVMTRQVLCLSKDGNNLSQTGCEPKNHPDTQKTCKMDTPCGGQWFGGPWSQCSAECGTGLRTREVICMKSLSGTISTLVSEDNCVTEDRPVTEEACDRRECGAEWFMTSWSSCSVTCGTGHQTRELKCLDGKQNISSLCDASDKPAARKVCNKNECTSKPKHQTGSHCKDRFSNCRVVAQARLCKYKFYKSMCCSTCSQSHH